MRHISEVLDDARDPVPELDLVPTGLGRLDEVVGGFAPGRLWVLTSAPGQGSSTLLIQWAGELAVNAGWLVALHVPREEPDRVAERLLASVSRVPLSGRHPWEVRRRDQAQELRIASAEESLRASRLSVRAWPSRGGLATMLRETVPGPRALLVDDIDLMMPAACPEHLRAASDAGAFVVAVVPRHLMVAGPCADDDLHPGWSRVADLVLELRSEGTHQWSAAWARDPEWSGWTGAPRRLGESSLLVLKNRHGPLFEVTLQNEVWRARFTDQHDAASGAGPNTRPNAPASRRL